MQRLPSTVALASWLGFVLIAILLPSSVHWGVSTGGAEIAGLVETPQTTGLLLVAAASLAGALALLHGPWPLRRRKGEALGLFGLAIIGAVAAVGWIAGARFFDADVTGAPFWSLLAASALFIGFDRLVAVEDEEDDEAAFEAAITAIAQSMARQTYLYAERELRGPETPES